MLIDRQNLVRCQNLKDLKVHRQSERMQGFAVDPVYVKGEVFAYVGLPQNLKDLKADPRDTLLRPERTQGFTAGPVYGRARCSPTLGSLKT